jgi:sulfite reductase (ferredoxin)
MQSFRSELEDLDNPLVRKDILDLADKISLHQSGQIDPEKFRSIRLARGVYGQRQPGVQMVRIKIPYGKMTVRQLRRIADISDEYASGTLHATTRQDIQIHYVSLDRTPELWARLEQERITLREACGNTVRNITASATAGIDPDEPFDVSPYAQAMFEYFLRNPVCQEMGRKFKIAFSSSERDSAFVFMHDLGFIPRIEQRDGSEVRGFKVFVGGGLGAIPQLAEVAYEFLPADRIIPFTEALLRVFDRYGERQRRQKARIKFLLKELGMVQLLKLVEEERGGLPHLVFPIHSGESTLAVRPFSAFDGVEAIQQDAGYTAWRTTNVFEQKQRGAFGVYVRVPLGNLSSDEARQFADIAEKYAADDIRITVNQGYLLKFVAEKALPALYADLRALGLAEPGFDTPADITACPGTDTCNLGISSSTGIASELSRVIGAEYPDLIHNHDIKIKISGCPNSCGQHGMASIGFHGSSLKHDNAVLPALQVVLGGGVDAGGSGRIAEKVIKIPSKRGPEALRTLLDDYDTNSLDGEYFKDYYTRQGKMYFYHLLKPLTDLVDLTRSDYVDWGREEQFEVQTEVGECAGVIIDLVSTLLFDSEEKLRDARAALQLKHYADAIYHSYNAFINSAKALLLQEDVKNNTQRDVIANFDKYFVDPGRFDFDGVSFSDHLMRIRHNKPEREFAERFFDESSQFLESVNAYREAVPGHAV